MRTLTLKEQEDLLLGCHILGTGGGGRLERGLALVRACAAAGRKLNLVSALEVPDDALVAIPHSVGSLTPNLRTQHETPESLPMVRAFTLLQEYVGEKFYGVLSAELGGGNTGVALATASVLGLPLVDADPAGRAVPEVFHTTFNLIGVGIAPMALVTQYGDEVLIPKVADDSRAEALARHIAMASGSTAAVADHPIRGRDLKRSVIEGTISYALRIGQAVAAARRDGSDPVAAAAKAGDGFVLFRGAVVRDAEWAEQSGFTVGSVEITGAQEFAGKRMRVEFKNEHMTAAIDRETVATIPDLIALVRTADAEPITNPIIPGGLAVSVVGYPSAAEWRTPKGLECFGPQYLGLKTPYVPIEQRFGPK